MKKINEYLMIKEASLFLGITPNTLRAWEKKGLIIPFRFPHSKYRFYSKEQLEEFLLSISCRKEAKK